MSTYRELSENIFNDLFILELANNHWGDVDRGIKIVKQHAQIIRNNGIVGAIKLQFRDVDNLIHKSYKNANSRYIQKTISTKLSKEDFQKIVDEIRSNNLIPMATPFDEISVDLCVEFGFPIIKIASSDINDWVLIKKIALTKLPVIVSTGGASFKSIKDVVSYFKKRNIPLAINHCVSNYPTEDWEMELNQIDFLKATFPDHVIGLSSHEYHDMQASMLISYAKGCRTWERHVDIANEIKGVSKYCSLPLDMDVWYKSYIKAKEVCGSGSNQRRVISDKEIDYLKECHRGFYLKRDMKSGSSISINDLYLAVPRLENQLSAREFIEKSNILNDKRKDDPLLFIDIA